MDNGRFSMFEAVRNAYVFTGREGLYLLKVGLLPMLAQIAIALFLEFERGDAGQIEGYLWGLPATALYAWFTFLEMRLLLLGERVEKLPADPAYLDDRRHAMKLSVILSLLVNMALAAGLSALMALAGSGQWGTNWLVTLGGLLLIGALFWSVRFGIVPILAAVHYPIRPVLQKTWGVLFALRLVGMGLMCLFPVALVFQVFLSFFLDKPADLSTAAKLTPPEQISLIFVNAPMSLLISALLNAAAAYALKQILGARRSGVVV